MSASLLAACLSMFMYADHQSLLLKDDYGHTTVGAGVECRSKRLSITGKVGTPVFANDDHDDHNKDWSTGDVIGSGEIRWYW